LLILTIIFSRGKGKPYPYLKNIGLLHFLWVFQHHPELSEILEQVENPIDHDLRVAGLVKVRLLDAVKLEAPGDG
jgi:hypothetical protein